MSDTLHDFIRQLEAHREQGREMASLLSVEPVRQLSVPLCHDCCKDLRAMAEVFGCDEALLASAILRGALRHIEENLTEDLDALARLAQERLDSPCERASEVI